MYPTESWWWPTQNVITETRVWRDLNDRNTVVRKSTNPTLMAFGSSAVNRAKMMPDGQLWSASEPGLRNCKTTPGSGISGLVQSIPSLSRVCIIILNNLKIGSEKWNGISKFAYSYVVAGASLPRCSQKIALCTHAWWNSRTHLTQHLPFLFRCWMQRWIGIVHTTFHSSAIMCSLPALCPLNVARTRL